MTDREILDVLILEVQAPVDTIRNSARQARETAGGETGCSVRLDVLAMHGDAILCDPVFEAQAKHVAEQGVPK